MNEKRNGYYLMKFFATFKTKGKIQTKSFISTGEALRGSKLGFKKKLLQKEKLRKHKLRKQGLEM